MQNSPEGHTLDAVISVQDGRRELPGARRIAGQEALANVDLTSP